MAKIYDIYRIYIGIVVGIALGTVTGIVNTTVFYSTST